MQAYIFWEVDKVFLKVLWDLDRTHIMVRPQGARWDEDSSSIRRRLSPCIIKRQASHTPGPGVLTQIILKWF